jgi:hypothetical protein
MTMQLIETKTLLSAAASIEFTSIPQDGTDLLVIGGLRSSSGLNLGQVGVFMNINGVSTNRTIRRLYGISSITGSDSGTGGGLRATLPTSTSTANTFSSLQIYFTNYSGATNKSFSLDNVSENNSTVDYELDMVAHLWSSTDAITTLTFTDGTGANFVSGSSLSLYKITKGSDGITTVS